MRINRHDTNGTKPLLDKGELGYDDYIAGGDAGRVYVGTGTANIPQAKKAEVVAVDGKVDTHVVRVDNPHSVTKIQVGLGSVDNTSDVNKPISTAVQTALGTKQNTLVSGTNIKTIEGQSLLGVGNIDLGKSDVGLSNVDNTADSSKNVLSATKFTNARNIALTGDVDGNADLDGSTNINIDVTLDIDGATDIGVNLSDTDLIIVDKGANGTNRKSAISRIWTYISGKLTGAISTVITSNLTASKVLVSDVSGKIAVSTTTSTELGYVSGVTSAIQTQLNAKVETNGLTVTDNAIVRFDGVTGVVQNSGVIIEDNNNVSAKGLIINSGEDISPSSSGIGQIKIAGNGYNGYITLDASGMHIGNNSAARTLTFDVDEIEQMTIDSDGNLGIKVPSNPNYAIDTGSTKGVKVALFNIIRSGIGYPAYGYNIRATTTTGTYSYDRADTSSVVEIGNRSWSWKTAPSGTAGNTISWTNAMTLDTSGDLSVPHTYSNTTASAANMFIDSSGKFYRSTSSKKYKKDIETIDKAYVDTFFDNARPIYYKSRSENDNPNWGYWGFIAEEIAEFDKRLVHWRFDTKEVEVEKERVLEDETIEKYTEIETVNDESKPMVAEGVMYERITVLLTARVQEQQKIINDLISRIETLEGAN